MRTKDGSEYEIESSFSSGPKIYISVGRYESGFIYLTPKEARKFRTELTRAIRLTENKITADQLTIKAAELLHDNPLFNIEKEWKYDSKDS